MKRHPIRRLQVRFRRWRRSIEKKFTPWPKNSEVQELAIGIVRRAINYDNSNLLIAPISGDRYIHYNDIFIKLEHQRVTIINGTYTYDIIITSNDSERLQTMFNARLERTRKDWEEAIRSKTERSLKNIYNELLINTK
jgi:hypothetical protein